MKMKGKSVTNPHLKDAPHPSNNQDSRIHTLFRHDNIPDNLNYQIAFVPAALLATRLLRTQQSYHYLYATFFGKNRRSRVPSALGGKLSPNVPEEYASNKSIGELTDYEMHAVDTHLDFLSKRVQFKIGYLPARALGWTKFGTDPHGQDSATLIEIWISHGFCNMILDNRDPSKTAFLHFCMAIVLVHEFAHAAHMYILGGRPEDFFEDSLVAEAGFELSTRILGILPMIHPNNVSETHWAVWQTQPNLSPPYYEPGQVCRCVGKLPEHRMEHDFDPVFAEMLLDDAWWEASDDRSADLIPLFLRHTHNVCLFEAIPLSLREWLRGQRGESYAARRYAFADNPDLELRTVAPNDGTPLLADTPLPSKPQRPAQRPAISKRLLATAMDSDQDKKDDEHFA